jgi:glycosyltransferase involved in cell wall biosynthesis
MELITVKSLRDMESDYGRLCSGDVVTVPRDVARRWMTSGRAMVWAPAAPRIPVREVQAFLGAPEVKGSVDTPMVSCIMPTADRAAFVQGAIRNFFEQTYPEKELLIVDDGIESCESIVPKHQSVRLVQVPRMTLGAKRNAAIQLATGTIVIHWDDDDRSAPDRITRQVQLLRKSSAAIVGYRDVHFVDESGKQYLMTGEPKYAAGTSLCYRRDWALRHPFPDVRASEDNAFLQAAGSALVTVDSESRIIARIHKGNTVKKKPGGKGWRRIESKELPAWANI